MNLETELDEMEEYMDILIESIRRYTKEEKLDPIKLRGLKHMQRRYCRYQVLHHRMTGHYYLIERAKQ